MHGSIPPMKPGDKLLTAAQVLFMLLPLCSLYAKREGKPALPHRPVCVAMFSAIAAFSILVAMFELADHALGVYLCGANLLLRLIEAVRVAQLACRLRRPAADDWEHGLREALDAPMSSSAQPETQVPDLRSQVNATRKGSTKEHW